MRPILLLMTLRVLAAAPESPDVHRAAAIEAARHGNWRTAEARQRQALSGCRPCTPELRAFLRAELAGYLVLGGFPQAAVPLWKQSIMELPVDSPARPSAYLGLGVALHAEGRRAAALEAWQQACAHAVPGSRAHAACRFNVAVARMDSEPVWSELESVLPILLTAESPLTRATALLQTANAAILRKRSQRAHALLDQADAVISRELAPNHPFQAAVYEARARLAEIEGNRREARQWRKRANQASAGTGWDPQTVSLETLRKETRK